MAEKAFPNGPKTSRRELLLNDAVESLRIRTKIVRGCGHAVKSHNGRAQIHPVRPRQICSVLHLIWDPRRGQPGKIYRAIGGLRCALKKEDHIQRHDAAVRIKNNHIVAADVGRTGGIDSQQCRRGADMLPPSVKLFEFICH